MSKFIDPATHTLCPSVICAYFSLWFIPLKGSIYSNLETHKETDEMRNEMTKYLSIHTENGLD